MSYEQDRTPPLPPLRKVRIESDPSGDAPATSEVRVADENTVNPPTEVEKFSTRAGGSDPQPSFPALRKVHVDQDQDVSKPDESHGGNGKDTGAPKQSTFIPIAIWTIIAVFAFWVSCQLLPLVSYVFRFSCHDWRFYVTGGLVLIPFALLLFVSYRVFLLFRRLPSFPQIHKAGRESYELKDRLLHGYIDELPESSKYAESAGFEDAQKKEVVRRLDRMRGKEKTHYSDEVGWLDDFKIFTDLQKSRANKIIGHYSKLIGLKTAASPWKFVDIICVFLNSTLMVAALAKLYNRRVNRSAAFRLVFRWFLNIYISGELGQISATAANAIGEYLKEPVKNSLSDLGWLDGDWAGTVAQSMPFIAKFAGKVVEGGVNAYFAIRMGRKAVAAFEPLVSD